MKSTCPGCRGCWFVYPGLLLTDVVVQHNAPFGLWIRWDFCILYVGTFLCTALFGCAQYLKYWHSTQGPSQYGKILTKTQYIQPNLPELQPGKLWKKAPCLLLRALIRYSSATPESYKDISCWRKLVLSQPEQCSLLIRIALLLAWAPQCPAYLLFFWPWLNFSLMRTLEIWVYWLSIIKIFFFFSDCKQWPLHWKAG